MLLGQLEFPLRIWSQVAHVPVGLLATLPVALFVPYEK
jgi:hypothetical protein